MNQIFPAFFVLILWVPVWKLLVDCLV